MKAITLRDIPKPIAERIEERSRRTGASLNRTVIELLAEPAGRARQELHHDLDHLFGTWTDEETESFDESLRELRAVDPEQWR